MPQENEKDVKDIPDEVKEQLQCKTIRTVEDLIKETLGLALPESEALMLGNLLQDITESTESIGI